MKKNFIGIILFIMGIVLIGSGVYISTNNVKPPKSNTEEKESFYNLPEEKRLSLKICKTDSCERPTTDNFDTLVITDKYPLLNKQVDKINKDTNDYYSQVKKSTTDSAKCIAVKDLYYHELSVSTRYFNYENDKYISIAVQRDISNLCDGSFERKQVEWYLYDKKNNKLLNQEEFKVAENISQTEINSAIKITIDNINAEENMNIIPKEVYDDTIVFYDFQGNILISFYVPEKNLYYSGTVRYNPTAQ